jgi:hypothetical protein
MPTQVCDACGVLSSVLHSMPLLFAWTFTGQVCFSAAGWNGSTWMARHWRTIGDRNITEIILPGRSIPLISAINHMLSNPVAWHMCGSCASKMTNAIRGSHDAATSSLTRDIANDEGGEKIRKLHRCCLSVYPSARSFNDGGF